MEYLKEAELNAAIREVMKRVVVDADFRALALKDGNAAIEAVAGKTLEAGKTLTFISNEGSSSKAVVLPDPVSDASLLSEEELEQIAGGMKACGVSSCGTSS